MPAATSARRRVTDVRARLFAQGMAVTTAGVLVALHLHTDSGTVVVTMTRTVFAAARAERDANGMPFRALAAEVAPPEPIDPPASTPPPSHEVGVVVGETSTEIKTRLAEPKRNNHRSPEYIARLRLAVAEGLAALPVPGRQPGPRIDRLSPIAAKYRLSVEALRRSMTRARDEIAEHGERPTD
ncbi:MAG: hypothetical protein H7067_07665 [Burkholderiales bacterium]|nr:hypothetical protein [Opitutaceae bacterium]